MQTKSKSIHYLPIQTTKFSNNLELSKCEIKRERSFGF